MNSGCPADSLPVYVVSRSSQVFLAAPVRQAKSNALLPPLRDISPTDLLRVLSYLSSRVTTAPNLLQRLPRSMPQWVKKHAQFPKTESMKLPPKLMSRSWGARA